MLWPSSTIRLNAGSWPEGSKSCWACVNASRRYDAAIGMGTPVG